jgi:hypothetical protein
LVNEIRVVKPHGTVYEKGECQITRNGNENVFLCNAPWNPFAVFVTRGGSSMVVDRSALRMTHSLAGWAASLAGGWRGHAEKMRVVLRYFKMMEKSQDRVPQGGKIK